jgi:hypothetical protein
LYRSPLPRNGAILPYIFTNPPKETVLAGQDKIIIFGNPQIAAAVLLQFEIALDRRDGKVSLGVQVSIDSFQEKKKKIVPEFGKKASATRLNPMPKTNEYQPMGGGEKLPRNRVNSVTDYQPVGGGEKKPRNRVNSVTDYQPMGAMEKKPSVRSNPADYQPMGAMEKKPSVRSNPADYQPMGAMEKKPSVRSNPADYQPMGAMEKKPSVRSNPADYQPMGARHKPIHQENQLPSAGAGANPTPFAPSQYVPRGAARVHPISLLPTISPPVSADP